MPAPDLIRGRTTHEKGGWRAAFFGRRPCLGESGGGPPPATLHRNGGWCCHQPPLCRAPPKRMCAVRSAPALTALRQGLRRLASRQTTALSLRTDAVTRTPPCRPLPDQLAPSWLPLPVPAFRHRPAGWPSGRAPWPRLLLPPAGVAILLAQVRWRLRAGVAVVRVGAPFAGLLPSGCPSDCRPCEPAFQPWLLACFPTRFRTVLRQAFAPGSTGVSAHQPS